MWYNDEMRSACLVHVYIHTYACGQNILTVASFLWTGIAIRLLMYICMVVGIDSSLRSSRCYSDQCPNHISESFVWNATLVYVNSLPPLGHSSFVRATPMQWYQVDCQVQQTVNGFLYKYRYPTCMFIVHSVTQREMVASVWWGRLGEDQG